jgi:hypothetical protein
MQKNVFELHAVIMFFFLSNQNSLERKRTQPSIHEVYKKNT